MKSSEYFRNQAVLTPALIFAASVLCPISHRVAGITALVMIVITPVLAALPSVGEFLSRNKRCTYPLAVCSWLLGIIFVARFVWKVIH